MTRRSKKPRRAGKPSSPGKRRRAAGAAALMAAADGPRSHIDCHIHFFNLRYLPVAGIALKRGGLAGPALAALAWLLKVSTPDDPALDPTGPMALRVAEDPDRSRVPPDTEYPPMAADEADVVKTLLARVPDEAFEDPQYERIVAEPQNLFSAAARGDSQSLLAPGAKARRRALASHLRQRNEAWTLSGNVRRTDDIGPGLAGVLQFLGNLMTSERRLVARARLNQAGVGLFVPLMMDMEAVFETPAFYDYERAMARMANLSEMSSDPDQGVAVLPMIAFDPYRGAGDGSRSGLDMVRDAIENRGFAGVKFYPPLGYRAIGNERSELPVLTKEDLDARCRALFDYCLERRIPIVGHCTPHGMELSPSHKTGLNADPVYWSVLLSQPGMSELRLCLAHTGGDASWDAGRDLPVLSAARPPAATAEPWGAGVLELAGQYPNVYCDLADFTEVTEPGRGRDDLRDSLRHAIDAQGGSPRRFPLRDKIIYGTDYPMVAPGGAWQRFYPEFLALFQGDEALRSALPGVFRENAARFLNLADYLERNRDKPGSQRRVQALERFLGA